MGAHHNLQAHRRHLQPEISYECVRKSTKWVCTSKSHVLALLSEANNVIRPVPSLKIPVKRYQCAATAHLQVETPFILDRVPLINDVRGGHGSASRNTHVQLSVITHRQKAEGRKA